MTTPTPAETRLLGKALAAISHRQAALANDGRERLRTLPVRRALEAFDAYPDGADFTFVSSDVENLDAELRTLGGDSWASWYWTLVLLELVPGGLQGARPYTLPPPVHAELTENLELIVDVATSNEDRTEPLRDTEFLLDVALSRGAVVPFQTAFGVTRPSGPGGKDVAGGRWVEGHFRSFEGPFVPAVLAACMDPICEFFVVNEDYDGWFAYTWLVDPALADFSPHLAWYREVLLAAGAEITPAGTDERTVAHATGTSRTRRRLFEEGRYSPRDYRFVLRREDLLGWHEATAGML